MIVDPASMWSYADGIAGRPFGNVRRARFERGSCWLRSGEGCGFAEEQLADAVELVLQTAGLGCGGGPRQLGKPREAKIGGKPGQGVAATPQAVLARPQGKALEDPGGIEAELVEKLALVPD